MTALIVPHNGFAHIFCPGCRNLVAFQAEDVELVYLQNPSSSPDPIATNLITCPCGKQIRLNP